MKVVLAIVGLLILIGVGYGLAFVGIIPVRSMAEKNPALKKVLVAIKLAPKTTKTVTTAHATAKPAPDPLAGERAALAAERMQLEQQRAAMQKKAVTRAVMASNTVSVVTTSPKVVAIYETMKPAELAALFEKLSDDQVCDALMKMDEQKAGKALVAMSPARAAKITTQMNRAMAARPQPGFQPQPAPATTVQ
ncbi:MAG TPA: hypothetical protein VGK19_10960 [Capsulimonadaceae bacterium]|jgi:flagellar motility protein MotE (MotC chaperone)